MKLDRNINSDGRGKYALLNWRTSKIEFGNTPNTEFFVIKLKDRFAAPALRAYAESVEKFANEIGGHEGIELQEYAGEIFALAETAIDHPLQKTPD